MPSSHARLSPSTAHRWLNCPGSVALGEKVEDRGSRDAAEGTACHEVLERILNGDVVQPGFTAKNGVQITVDHILLVEPVLEYIRAYTDSIPNLDFGLYTEARFEIGKPSFDLPAGELYGTADVVVEAPEELLILDAKFGYVDVSVEENEQLMLYALGALYATGWAANRVRIVIVQPKNGGVKEHVCTGVEMQAFEEDIRERVLEAYNGGPLRPTTTQTNGSDPCQWCRAQAVCPALRDEITALAQREMASPASMTPEELSEVLEKGAAIENAMRAIRAHVRQLLELGTPIPGWKLVQGEKHRAWKDETAAVSALKRVGLSDEEVYARELRSPAQMEAVYAENLHSDALAGRANVAAAYERLTGEPLKRLTKTACKRVAAETISLAGAYRPRGEPVLVRGSDPRPPVDPAFSREELAGELATVIHLPTREEID